MEIAIIGSGHVGGTLADRLERAGHRVYLAARDPSSKSVLEATGHNPRLQVRSPKEAVAAAEVVFLATPFAANAAALEELGEGALAGKVLVDCTNPVGPGLSHGLGSARSGSEVVQGLAKGARVVKAFSIYGYEVFAEPHFPNAPTPAMLYCGADATAKATVARLIQALGFDPLDVGGLEQALHLEHLTLLWIRMVRAGGRPAGLAWAALRR